MRLECPAGYRWLRRNEYPIQGSKYLDWKTKRWVNLGKGQMEFQGRDFIVVVIRPLKNV